MPTFKRYHTSVPAGSIVVRIVEAGGKPFGFVRDVEREDEDDAYPTEQKPIDQVWRLVDNKLKAKPDAAVYVDMEAGMTWQDEWGRLGG